MYYNRKKAIIKNVVFIVLIFTIAIVATYNIYYHFVGATDIDYSSNSLDITFHEKNGAKVTLTKATPVTDSVGLSSDTYTLTIKNNLIEPVKYQIKLVDDYETMLSDYCTEHTLPKELLKVAIKEGNGKNDIYTLSDLKDGILKDEEMKPLEEKDYFIRIWLSNSPSMNIGNDFHYHGLIQVVEDGDNLAVR